jgi:hypothetical protein
MLRDAPGQVLQMGAAHLGCGPRWRRRWTRDQRDRGRPDGPRASWRRRRRDHRRWPARMARGSLRLRGSPRGCPAATGTPTAATTTRRPEEDRVTHRPELRFQQGHADGRGQAARRSRREPHEGEPDSHRRGRGAHRLDRVGRLQHEALAASRRHGARLHDQGRDQREPDQDGSVRRDEADRQQQDGGGKSPEPPRGHHLAVWVGGGGACRSPPAPTCTAAPRTRPAPS